jgi:hypothetical protein
MDKVEEMREQRERLDKAGTHFKYSEANAQGWMIEAVFNDAEGVGDLMTLTSVDEVDTFIGSFCPNCWRVDQRRRRGGLCSSCAQAIASAKTPD